MPILGSNGFQKRKDLHFPQVMEEDIKQGGFILRAPSCPSWLKRERKAGYGKDFFDDVWYPLNIFPGDLILFADHQHIRMDKVMKTGIYAEHGVKHLRLLGPLARTLDVFGLDSDRWVFLGMYLENDRVRAEPFPEAEIELELMCVFEMKI